MQFRQAYLAARLDFSKKELALMAELAGGVCREGNLYVGHRSGAKVSGRGGAEWRAG